MLLCRILRSFSTRKSSVSRLLKPEKSGGAQSPLHWEDNTVVGPNIGLCGYTGSWRSWRPRFGLGY
jgi:hypothetical protein